MLFAALHFKLGALIFGTFYELTRHTFPGTLCVSRGCLDRMRKQKQRLSVGEAVITIFASRTEACYY